jgi:PAS domain S-box-containing protein
MYSKDLCTKVLEHAPVGVAVVQGEELRILYANPVAREVLGYEAALSEAPLPGLTPAARQRMLEHLRRVVHTHDSVSAHAFDSLVITSAEGTPTHWDIDCLAMDADDDGEADAAMLMMQDVTMHVALRRQAEVRAQEAEQARAALSATEQRFRVLVEGSIQGIIVVERINGDFKPLFANDAAARMLGYQTGAELLALTSLAHLVPEPVEADVRAQWRRLLQGEISRIADEVKLMRHDGATLWVKLMASRVEWNNRPALQVTLVDVTAEHILRERLEQFVRRAAHDLRSPLQTVQAFSDLLLRSARERLHDAEHEYLGTIRAGVRQVDVLIEGLLAHAYAAHAEIPPTSVDLEAVLNEVLAALKAATGAAGAEVTHDRLPTVTGHRVLLGQVLQNLIVNALKFRRAQPPKIHIGVRRDDGNWIISVRDNGIGVPPADQERLFEAFVRGKQKRDVPGVGLGLALVREAVGQHHGRVWLESTPGEGTTFYISLPDSLQARTY